MVVQLLHTLLQAWLASGKLHTSRLFPRVSNSTETHKLRPSLSEPLPRKRRKRSCLLPVEPPDFLEDARLLLRFLAPSHFDKLAIDTCICDRILLFAQVVICR
jgi:hypothetical protein